jgi:hypothetical protein
MLFVFSFIFNRLAGFSLAGEGIPREGMQKAPDNAGAFQLLKL